MVILIPESVNTITVYADGVSYTVSSSGAIEVPLSTTALMTFTYSGTIYGGVVIRNIGYVAVQCLDDFTAGTVQYNYVKKIVDYVYPDGYTEWSSAKY